MNKALLTKALKLARAKLQQHPQYSCFPHWTFIVRANQIIGYGLNRQHEPLRNYGYHTNDDKTYRPKWHSEVDAIKRVYRRGLSSFEAINIRLNRRGECRPSMPCGTCSALLKVLGCNRVWFSTLNEWGTINYGY